MHTKGRFFLLIGFVLFAACRPGQVENAGNTDYLIAYNVLVDANQDNYEVFIMEADGSGKKNLTAHPDVAWAYQACGDRIFFLSDRDTSARNYLLYSMNSSGEDLQRITDFPLEDSWMGCRKNGTELIIAPHRSLDSLLYLINLNGELLQKIAPGTPYSSDPTFSPDGSQIAFVGQNKRSKREPDFKAEIYVVNVDGTGLRQLSHYPEQDTTAEWYAYKAGPPKWHPTENFISYQSKQNGKYSLYAVRPDGSKQWKLTDNERQEGWHSWSPDGKWLAIELFDSIQSQFHIGLMNWDTKALQILTDTSYQYQQAPVFVQRHK